VGLQINGKTGYIARQIEAEIKARLFQGKIILIFGARQTGKTTLVKKLLADYADRASVYLNCEEGDIRDQLNQARTSTELRSLIGPSEIVVLDEAQKINRIGEKLKLIHDRWPEIQLIATGSSSFELGQQTGEALTGRNFKFWLHPFSIKELGQVFSPIEIKRRLADFLIFGLYPEVALTDGQTKKQELITHLAQDYLFKDILARFGLKGEETARRLLQALALQIGQEVSYNELANLIGVAKETVARYLQILEQNFIIFRLRAFSRNPRKEIARRQKIFFYDLGIRNALIQGFNPLNLRADLGALWENFLVAEKKKEEIFAGQPKRLFFWRSYSQAEVDLVEAKENKLAAFEFKWQKPRKRPPKAWVDNYPESTWQCITRENFWQFIATPTT